MIKIKNSKLFLIIVVVVIAIVGCFIFSFQSVKNKAISYEEQISTAQSNIKIQEKRRTDLIPNLVDCVKAYDKHEYDTLMSVVKTRGTNSDNSVKEIKTQIQAIAEAYPKLQSSSNYQELMNELAVTENKIANVRNNYNSWVTRYNAFVRQFPSSQILSMLGYEIQDYAKITFDVSSDAPTNLFE